MKIILINRHITPEERYGSVVKEGGGKQALLKEQYVKIVKNT